MRGGDGFFRVLDPGRREAHSPRQPNEYFRQYCERGGDGGGGGREERERERHQTLVRIPSRSARNIAAAGRV